MTDDSHAAAAAAAQLEQLQELAGVLVHTIEQLDGRVSLLEQAPAEDFVAPNPHKFNAEGGIE
jgi:hypothetical protein